MAIFRWGHAWDPFRDLEREVDRLLATVSATLQGARVGREYPPVNVHDSDTELLLTAELAGTRMEDLEITIADGVLTLKGKRSGPEGIADERYRRQERARGSWQRSINLPDRIEEGGLSAEYNNGILVIHLPKAPATPVRQIRVVDSSTAAPVSPLPNNLPAGE